MCGGGRLDAVVGVRHREYAQSACSLARALPAITERMFASSAGVESSATW